MPRPVRFIPEGGALVEITGRTMQGRFLFIPSATFTDIALGVLGRAQRLHNVRLFGYVVLSNSGIGAKRSHGLHPTANPDLPRKLSSGAARSLDTRQSQVGRAFPPL